MLFWCCLLSLQSLFLLTSAQLPNCSFPAVYAFGDSLSDTGNSIAAFPEKFANAEQDPNGLEFPMHAADRYTDGKLVVDFLGKLVDLAPRSSERKEGMDLCDARQRVCS